MFSEREVHHWMEVLAQIQGDCLEHANPSATLYYRMRDKTMTDVMREYQALTEKEEKDISFNEEEQQQGPA